MPLGTSWRAKVSPSTTMVWPALWPPWYRTTSSISLARRSVSFPLPSSPHWVPTTTVAGTRLSSVAKSGLRTSVTRRRGLDAPNPPDSEQDDLAVLLVHGDRASLGVVTL